MACEITGRRFVAALRCGATRGALLKNKLAVFGLVVVI
jgi:hypothetical protein